MHSHLNQASQSVNMSPDLISFAERIERTIMGRVLTNIRQINANPSDIATNFNALANSMMNECTIEISRAENFIHNLNQAVSINYSGKGNTVSAFSKVGMLIIETANATLGTVNIAMEDLDLNWIQATVYKIIAMDAKSKTNCSNNNNIVQFNASYKTR